MKHHFSKGLKSIFLGSALAFGATTAYAADQTTEKPASVTVNKKVVAKTPIHQRDLSEWLKTYNSDHVRAWKKYEFYQQREIHLEGPVNKITVDKLIAEIELLDKINPGKKITLRINSPGGSVNHGLRLYNAMQMAKSPIRTVADGDAASMAAILLIAGDVREVTPGSRVLIHQVSAGTGGKLDSMEKSIVDFNVTQDTLYRIISKNTGLSYADITRIGKSDVYYNAKESLTLGFVDAIVTSSKGRNFAPGSRSVPENLYPDNRVLDYYKNKPRNSL